MVFRQTHGNRDQNAGGRRRLRAAAAAVLAAGLLAVAWPVAAQPRLDESMKESPAPPRTRFAEEAPSAAVEELQPVVVDPKEARSGFASGVLPAEEKAPAETPKAVPAETVLTAQEERQPLPKVLPVPGGEKLPKGGAELPAPKAGPFGPDRVRLPRMGQGPLGTTPVPTEDDLREFNQFIGGVIDPRHTFDLVEGRTRIILLKETPTQIQVADEGVMSYNLLNPKQMIVIGRAVGTTVMTMWFRDPADPNNANKEKILSYLVRVLPDPERKERLEAVYKALEREINRRFPDCHIKIDLVGDKVVVSGQAKDVANATHILQIVRANAPADGNRLPVANLNLNVNAQDLLNPNGTPGLDSFVTAGGPNIVNLIRIPGEQQVMLRVTVAEVNRTAARSIGLNFNIINNRGTQVFGQQTGGITISGSVFNQNNNNNNGGVIANLPVVLDQGQVPIAISALKALNYARSLAEPNLTALNGQTASFQAGGQFPVPVIGGFGVGGANPGIQGVQFIPFGVLLNFTPIITDRDRIRLNVQANVSTRDTSTGTNLGGSFVPGLNSRNFTTTVEMREGQTLAVAGLIQNNIAADTQRVPFFGDIPILNRLMGYDQLNAGEQELVILITPELVRPLEKKQVPKMPGADLFEPSDLDFFFFGKLENRRPYDYRSSTMTDIHRMIRYKKAEQQYIFGPVGHTDDPNYPFHPYDQYYWYEEQYNPEKTPPISPGALIPGPAARPESIAPPGGRTGGEGR